MKPSLHGKRLAVLAIAVALGSVYVMANGVDTSPPKAHGRVPQAVGARPVNHYRTLPLVFEANNGQTDSRVRFVSRGSGYTLFLMNNEAVLSLRKPEPPSTARPAVSEALGQREFPVANPTGRATSHASDVLRMALVGANSNAEVVGLDELPGRSNYFIGNDPKNWRTNVPTYAKVKYEGVYPGIDLVYYGNHRQLEYDFVVAPGADPNSIAWEFGDSADPTIDVNGDLLIRVDEGEVRFQKPVVYQPGFGSADAERRFIDGRFVRNGKHSIGFDVAAYDRSRPLVIDPVLAYGTYLGGSGEDEGQAIAVDQSGSIYIAGWTASADFPTPNGWDTTHNGGNRDAFIAKFNAGGSTLAYSTYLGGSGEGMGGDDEAYGIAVDDSGNAWVAGLTRSRFFPTVSALQATHGGSGNSDDAFLAKISATGSNLLFSTYLGTEFVDDATAVAVDASGNAYVTGQAGPGFPTTSNAYKRTCDACGGDAFLAKIKSDGSALLYSTFLGGDEGEDRGAGIAVDGWGGAYIVGDTRSTDFPVTADALQSARGGGQGQDAFVAKLDTTKSGSDSLVYSTYLGGSDVEFGNAIAVDSLGNAYATGMTFSTDFPITPNAVQGTHEGDRDVFVTKINWNGSALVYSTYLGSGFGESGRGIAVDTSGHAHVTGFTQSSGFPAVNSLQPLAGTGSDSFVARFTADGSALVYSTLLGGGSVESGNGIALDSFGDAYVVGRTVSADFPTQDPLQGSYGGGAADVFVAKIEFKPDFSFSAVPPMTAVVGGSDSSQVRVNSIDEFSSPVALSIPAPPSGFTVLFGTDSVTPPSLGSVETTLTVSLGPAATAGTYGFDITGNSGALTHTAPVTVAVHATPAGVAQVIGTMEALGCVDNPGVSNALTSKLAAAQAFIDAGAIQAAINTLTALLHQLYAQAGKHITTLCTVDGMDFDATEVLIANVKALLASLGVGVNANVVEGFLVDTGGRGIGDVKVNILNSANTVIDSVTTDATGFFYLAKTTSLVVGSKYTFKVVPLKPFKGSTPASRALTWNRTAVILDTFVLN